MKFELTKHASDAISERNIPVEYIEWTLAHPDKTIRDGSDINLVHYLAKINENGDRVLRVIVNTEVSPLRVVTVFLTDL